MDAKKNKRQLYGLVSLCCSLKNCMPSPQSVSHAISLPLAGAALYDQRYTEQAWSRDLLCLANA